MYSIYSGLQGKELACVCKDEVVSWLLFPTQPIVLYVLIDRDAGPLKLMTL